MKDNLDLWSAFAGALAALLKGIKHKLKMKQLILSLVVAAVLAWGTIGLLQYFFASKDIDVKVIILTSFSVGWIANEITDVLDEFAKNELPRILRSIFRRSPKKKEEDEK